MAHYSLTLSSIFTANTPGWLLITVVVLSMGTILGFLVWALILELRYISPYTVITASNREKWRRAAILALLQTSMIPILGFAAPILSPLSDQWLFIPVCIGIWIVVFPVAVLHKRWEFERRIKKYRYFDRQLKNKLRVDNRALVVPFRFITTFMTADQKRFFREGFPEDNSTEKTEES